MQGRRKKRGATGGEPAALHRRLKGLDEFAPPSFIGRMERVARRRSWAWRATLAGATLVGAGIGLLIS